VNNMAKKKRLSKNQEFEIMKMVLDKFLWLGFIVMGWGVWRIIADNSYDPGIYFLFTGIVVLIIFLVVIIKEYEIIA